MRRTVNDHLTTISVPAQLFYSYLPRKIRSLYPEENLPRKFRA